MRKKFKIQIKSKHLIVLLTMGCVSAMALTANSVIPFAPVRNAAGLVIVPFQNGINAVGNWMQKQVDGFIEVQELSEKNREMQKEIDSLKEENNLLIMNQKELERLQELYELDKSYAQYDKVAAQVISRDPGNWCNSFVINKGSDDGIQVDMNVIADGGLVGLVTGVGKDWATVQSIIDDSSNVSAMSATTLDTCVVSGDLRLMDEGKLQFSQMTISDKEVPIGDKIVTSNISDKYLKGILIGYVDEISEDSNQLSNTGYLIPVVDFKHIQEVLVIKELKQQKGEES